MLDQVLDLHCFDVFINPVMLDLYFILLFDFLFSFTAVWTPVRTLKFIVLCVQFLLLGFWFFAFCSFARHVARSPVHDLFWIKGLDQVCPPLVHLLLTFIISFKIKLMSVFVFGSTLIVNSAFLGAQLCCSNNKRCD